MTVSSQVTGGEQETLCAHIHGAAEPVSVTVVLETGPTSSVVLEEDVQQDFDRCVNFQVCLHGHVGPEPVVPFLLYHQAFVCLAV